MRSRDGGEEGMITVEAVLSLVPFIVVILGIISFINIFLVHNKIQYALYQMSNELSCYTYFYQALGLRAADLDFKGDIDEQTKELDGAIEDINGFLAQIESLQGSVNGLGDGSSTLDEIKAQGQGAVDKGGQAVDSMEGLLSDPKALLRGFVYLGVEKAEGAAKSLLLGAISNGLLELYLDERFVPSHPMVADEYLKHYGVMDGMNGLDYGKSELFSDDGYRLINIVVEYDLEITIFKLFLKDPTIHVVQRCTVPAWLDGDGVVYP